MKDFIFSCESTIDLPYEYCVKRNASVLEYSYTIDDNVYHDDMGRTEGALEKFYNDLKGGKISRTSQVNKFHYVDYFEELLKKGDVIHIAFGSGLTPSVNNAYEAQKELLEKYPDRKLIVLDSVCASAGYGLLVDLCLDLRDENKTMEEIEQFVLDIRYNIHHQFFSSDVTYFRRSGRVSGATAMIATVLGICPIMRTDEPGHLISYSKAHGKKKAINKTVEEMIAHAVDHENYAGKCFIAHSACLEDALMLKEKVAQTFLKVKEIRMCNIGNIIGSHCGPGTVAVFFIGDRRAK